MYNWSKNMTPLAQGCPVETNFQKQIGMGHQQFEKFPEQYFRIQQNDVILAMLYLAKKGTKKPTN